MSLEEEARTKAPALKDNSMRIHIKTLIASPLTFLIAGCVAVACNASAGDNSFQDDEDNTTSGDPGAGAGAGDLGITTTNTSAGSGILAMEPKCDDVNPDIDNDGDGWTGALGDCNDCTELMNPGAQDYDGNAIDDDCNGAKDDNPSLCDGALSMDANNPEDAARAMGLCKLQGGDKERWGLISAQYILADGSPFSGYDPLGYGILTGFGTSVNPQEGKQMFVLSSGAARGPNDPGYESPGGYDKYYTSGSPAGYPKETPSCPGVSTGEPHDSVGLRIKVKTPTNAKSLRFMLNFYTYEFPGFICTQYNDYFVAMLNPIPSGQPDGNISYDSLKNTISVNAGFLRVCHATMAGGKDFPCDLGHDALTGTGFDVGSNSAATSWLQTTSPLVDPGGEIELDFAIWDSGDGILDSTVLLDNFGFVIDETPTETAPVPEPK